MKPDPVGPLAHRTAERTALMAQAMADQEILDGVVEGWRWPDAARHDPPGRLDVEALTRPVKCDHPDRARYPGPVVMVRELGTEGPRGALERFASPTEVCGRCGVWRRTQLGLHHGRPWRLNLDRAVADGIDDG